MSFHEEAVAKLKAELAKELAGFSAKAEIDKLLEGSINKLVKIVQNIEQLKPPANILAQVEKLKDITSKTRVSLEKAYVHYASIEESRNIHKENFQAESSLSLRKTFSNIINATLGKKKEIGLNKQDVKLVASQLTEVITILNGIITDTSKAFAVSFSEQKQYTDAAGQLSHYLQNMIKLIGEVKKTDAISKLVDQLKV